MSNTLNNLVNVVNTQTYTDNVSFWPESDFCYAVLFALGDGYWLGTFNIINVLNHRQVLSMSPVETQSVCILVISYNSPMLDRREGVRVRLAVYICLIHAQRRSRVAHLCPLVLVLRFIIQCSLEVGIFV